MKQLLFIFTFLATSLVVAQDQFTATFDYEVTYEIPDTTKGKDTIKIAFDKSGRYLWTDYSKISDRYAFLLSQSETLQEDDMSINIIYDTETTKVYMNLYSSHFSFFMKMNLTALLPNRMASRPFSESFEMLTEKSSKKASLLGKEYPVYKVYPENFDGEKDKINIVFGEDFPVNNNTIFKSFLDLMTNDDNDAGIKTNFPKGIILQVASPSPKEEVLVKAINVKKVSKTITINNTLEIKE